MSRTRPPPRPRSRRAAARQLRARRTQLRKQLQEQLQDARRQRSGPRRRRRWPWLVLALALALLVLLRDCSCSEPPPPVEVQLPAAPAPAAPVRPAPRPQPAPQPIPPARLARRDRPAFHSEPPSPLPWIASFRGQVAARSPRLAACFVGAERPGTLRWTASVEPGHGQVSEHVLEPTLATDALTGAQRACVVAVLSDPPYRLADDGERATPSRISVVIEF